MRLDCLWESEVDDFDELVPGQIYHYTVDKSEALESGMLGSYTHQRYH